MKRGREGRRESHVKRRGGEKMKKEEEEKFEG